MMSLGRLFWKLFLGSLVLVAMVLAVCAWLVARDVDWFNATAVSQQLTGHAKIISRVVEDRFDLAHAGELGQFVRQAADTLPQPTRITLILPNGRVLADSMGNPAEMESHATRPEFLSALATGWGEDLHESHTLGLRMHYVAVRVGAAEAPRGVVRVSMSTDVSGARARVLQTLVWKVFLVGAVAFALFAMGLARLWSEPIRRMTIIARSLSRGDLSARVRVSGSDEVAELGRSLNQMRDHLVTHLETIDRQRRILESLLAQLLEGVIVAGPDGRVLLINPAAVQLLGLSPPGDDAGVLVNRPVEAFVSNPQLRDMLLIKLEPAGPGEAGREDHHVREARIRMSLDEGETSVLARSSDIHLPQSMEHAGSVGARSSVGRLLVLTDVTELTRALQVKSDFAANASHELRTPLAAIVGAVEALLDMDLAADAAAARPFVEMVHRHAARMQAMVADLLDLSRLESTPDQFKPQNLVIRQQLGELQARHAEKLKGKNLEWRSETEAGLETLVANAHLLRLTLDNLVDNSIKYTAPGGYVSVTCRRARGPGDARGHIVFEVIDNGCGIPAEHQSRVFERFYQVEAARSGALRGTGLGLSIVRHAVNAMGGRVELRSGVDAGTCVTVWIPE